MNKKIGITILLVVLVLLGIFLWLGRNSNSNLNTPNSSSGNSIVSVESKESNGYYLIKDEKNQIYLTTLEGITVDALISENSLSITEDLMKYEIAETKKELDLTGKTLTFINWDDSNELKKQAVASYNNINSLELLESMSEEFQVETETKITFTTDEIQMEGQGVDIKQETFKVDGIERKGEIIEITQGGAYRISGTLENGRILVNAKDEKVQLILDNANISCEYSSPIYIYKSEATQIILEDGTSNYLSDGTMYIFQDEYTSEVDEEPNACLYSKSDLILLGSGKLNVTANYNNGITSKDTLMIYESTLEVTAKNHGINGKDSNWIQNANISVKSGGDAIRASNDTDTTLGWIAIGDSSLSLDSAEDGVQAETSLKIWNSELNITTGDGSAAQTQGELDDLETEDVSKKGVKAGTAVLLCNNQMKFDSYDDSIHSDGNINITDGSYEIQTGDDGIHAEGFVTIHSGNINVVKSCEGIEGSNIIIYDGDIQVTSTDDGINVAGDSETTTMDKFELPDGMEMPEGNGRNPFVSGEKVPEERYPFGNEEEIPGGRNPFGDGERNQGGRNPFGSGAEMPGRRNPFGSGEKLPDGMKVNENMGNVPEMGFIGNGQSAYDSEMKLVIWGGKIVVNAEGDGIDSNGSIIMSGGEVIVHGPTNSGNGAIDYATSFEITGGTLIAMGTAGMAQTPSSQSSQVYITANLNRQNANTKVTLKNANGEEIFSTTSVKTFSHIVISLPEFVKGEKYTLYLNDEQYSEIEAGSSSNMQNGGMRGQGSRDFDNNMIKKS